MGEAGDTDEGGARRGIQSVEIGLGVLEALAEFPAPALLGDIARAAGLSASQSHRYLASLVKTQMAVALGGGRYSLGPAAVRLGLSALARTDAFRLADDAATQFVERTGRTVQIASLGPLGPTIVRWLAGTPPVTTSFNVGSVVSMLHSATGHAFIAFRPMADVQSLIHREMESWAAPADDVTALAEKVRRQGYAAVEGTVVPGLRAVAAPIFDLQGRAVLTVTILATQTMSRDRDATAINDLLEMCRGVSERLGYRK